MVNLLKMVCVSCFENKSGIRQNLLIDINIPVMVILFHVVGFIKDYIYSCIYDSIDVKLFWGQF